MFGSIGSIVRSVGSALKKGYEVCKDKAMALVGGTTAAVAGVLSSVQDAQAALPAEATAAFTSLSGAVTDVLAAVWPIVGAVLAGFVTIKLVKRGASKV